MISYGDECYGKDMTDSAQSLWVGAQITALKMQTGYGQIRRNTDNI